MKNTGRPIIVFTIFTILRKANVHKEPVIEKYSTFKNIEL